MWYTSVAAVVVGALTWGVQSQDDKMRRITLRTHTLEQPYLDSDMQSRWFDFGGDTIVRTDSHIRLTSERPSQSGWLFSRVPLTATNWEVEVEFKIAGSGHLFGDGLAMWLTSQHGERGPVFGNTDKFEGLGIFIDTYKNNRPGVVFPYVMAVSSDGTKHYDKNDDGKDVELAGCSARGIRGASIPTKMRATYFQDKYLKLELQYKSEDEWQTCFHLDKPPQLPNVVYLGFSSETGELSDNHDIISVKTANLYEQPGPSSPQKPLKDNRGGSRDSFAGGSMGGSSWTWFFTKIIIFCFVVAGAYAGFTAYRAKYHSHRF